MSGKLEGVALKLMGSPIGARMVVDNREVDYFCGTSYFGLHGHPQVMEAARAAIATYGLGPATKAVVPPIEEAKELAREFLGVESVTYVISGYLGVMILAQALAPEYDTIFVDEKSHYSVFDGVASCGKRVVLFRHLDADDLEAKLKEHTRPGDVPMVMTDGVFPITGAIAPMRDYMRVLSGYPSSLLCTDDAHALGVLGRRGRGTFEYHELSGESLHTVGTLSKACGGIGGIIPGDRAMADRIAKNVRIQIGASAPPVPAAAAAATGLRLLMDHPEMREALRANVAAVREGFRGLGFDTPDTPVPIVNLVGRAGVDLKHVEESLLRDDIVVRYVLPHGYSDAPDAESLRIAVFSTHTPEQIARLVDSCRRAL